ncbi:6707_t:CDS:1, partial [Ambispora gerdemannii]
KTTLEGFFNQEFKEDSNLSDGFYSETTSNTKATEINHFFTDSYDFIPEFNTYSDFSVFHFEIITMSIQAVIEAI